MADNINEILSELSSEQLQALQAAILSNSLKNNRFLSNNLETRSQTIIGTINDMFSKANSNEVSNIATLERLHAIVGNPEGTAEEQNMYNRLMSTVIKGDTKTLTAGVLQAITTANDNELLVRTIERDTRTAVEGIQDTIKDFYVDFNYEEELYTGNTFSISCEPLDKNSVSIYINGVHYDNSLFDFSNNNKTMTWLYTTDFDILAVYKVATVFNTFKQYYTLNDGVYIPASIELSKEEFDAGTYYEADKENSDKILVRYSSLDRNHKSTYRQLYDVSLLNSVGVGINKDPNSSSNALMENYDWAGMRPILNQNLSGTYEYTNDGRVAIKVSAKDGVSNLRVLSANNWNNFAGAARVFVGGNQQVITFDDFCNTIYGTTENDKTWLSFFAFELGKKNYSHIMVISNRTDLVELASRPAVGNWYYDWNTENVGNDRAVAMEINPYIDLTDLGNKLISTYQA